MTFNVAAEFGQCHSADECTMDPMCMLYDNCCEVQGEMEEEMADG